MYIPAHFAADDATVRDLLARHGAADLITLTADGLLATMLPFAYEPAAGEQGALYGHVARNNDQWRKPRAWASRSVSLIVSMLLASKFPDDPVSIRDRTRRPRHWLALVVASDPVP
jgi:hypothetical protein